MNFFKLIRHLFTQDTPGKKKEKRYPNRYVVRCSISHPRVVGHIDTVLITIDAHSGSHARKQLQEELKLVVGRVVRSSRA